MRRPLFLAIAGVLSVVAATAAERPFRTENVFLVVIDGVRYSESFGDPERACIPRLANELAPLGVVNTAFYNQGQTRTVSGHASLITGTRQQLTNSYASKSRPTQPTLFEYYRKQRGGSKYAGLVASSKRKLTGLAHSRVKGYGFPYRATTEAASGLDHWAVRYLSSGYRDDEKTFERLVEAMEESHPHVVLVNLREPDTAGHRGDWDGYLRAIRQADDIVARLWERIQADEFYRDTTTLIVTNDHGRHLDAEGGFQEHGDDCEGCRHILFLALGPDIPAGREVATPRSLIDVVPTVAALLGLDAPHAEGEVMHELLRLPGSWASVAPVASGLPPALVFDRPVPGIPILGTAPPDSAAR